MADTTGANLSAPEPLPHSDDGSASHDMPMADHLRDALSQDWDPAPRMPHPAEHEPDVAASAAAHRTALSAHYRGQTVVVPAGQLKVRANDTDYPFRASSAFTWLSGETCADAVLVMSPNGPGHDTALYLRDYAQAGTPSYFTHRRHAAVWVGNVPSLADTADLLDVPTRSIDELDHALHGRPDTVVLRGIDPSVDKLVTGNGSEELAQAIDELRLVKNDWEVSRLRHACEATARGFADVVRELPAVAARPDLRGERWLEGTFWRRARLEGNEVGYTSIVASGPHATVLHWWRNHGVIRPGELLLADMGIETDELYTADVTRTMPISGEWSPAQLKVYRAVLEAQTAGIAEVKAGADFMAAHRAAMWVLADHLHSWGLLPVTAEVSCAEDPEAPGAGLHRRFTLHGTSHMLGIDVHDCAAARKETYHDGQLAAGNVLTVEPGLYFQVNDLSVPAELRGIGVRIEDDILTTDGAAVNLSETLPRDPEELTSWMRDVQATPARP